MEKIQINLKDKISLTGILCILITNLPEILDSIANLILAIKS